MRTQSCLSQNPYRVIFSFPPPRPLSLVSATAPPLVDSSRTSLNDNYDDHDTYLAHACLPSDQILKLSPNSPSSSNTISYEEVWRSRKPFLESRGMSCAPLQRRLVAVLDWNRHQPFIFWEDPIDTCVPFSLLFSFIPSNRCPISADEPAISSDTSRNFGCPLV